MSRGACHLCGCRRVLFDVSDQYSAVPGVSLMCGECCEGARRNGDLYFAFPTPVAVRAARRFVRRCGLSPDSFTFSDVAYGVSDHRYCAARGREDYVGLFDAASDSGDVAAAVCDVLGVAY